MSELCEPDSVDGSWLVSRSSLLKSNQKMRKIPGQRLKISKKRKIIFCHVLSCSLMVCHGLSWFIMVCHGLSWFIMVYHVLSCSVMFIFGFFSLSSFFFGFGFPAMLVFTRFWMYLDSLNEIVLAFQPFIY